jgi:hypothetical protein
MRMRPMRAGQEIWDGRDSYVEDPEPPFLSLQRLDHLAIPHWPSPANQCIWCILGDSLFLFLLWIDLVVCAVLWLIVSKLLVCSLLLTNFCITKWLHKFLFQCFSYNLLQNAKIMEHLSSTGRWCAPCLKWSRPCLDAAKQLKLLEKWALLGRMDLKIC